MVYCWYEGEIGPQINKQNVDAVHGQELPYSFLRGDIVLKEHFWFMISFTASQASAIKHPRSLTIWLIECPFCLSATGRYKIPYWRTPVLTSTVDGQPVRRLHIEHCVTNIALFWRHVYDKTWCPLNSILRIFNAAILDQYGLGYNYI